MAPSLTLPRSTGRGNLGCNFDESDPQQAAERAGAVIRLRAVVVSPDVAVAVVAEDRAAQLADRRGRLQPARRLLIERLELLKITVLLFVQHFDPHLLGHVDRGVGGTVL